MTQFQVPEICQCFRLIFRKKSRTVFSDLFRTLIDEQMIDTKCRISFIQYMPKKPKKFGIKIWAICEAGSGYVLGFQIYTGKTNGQSQNVSELAEKYLNKGYRLYFNNFYTSVDLLQYLATKKTYACKTEGKQKVVTTRNT